jgi:hypothetical protein
MAPRMPKTVGRNLVLALVLGAAGCGRCSSTAPPAVELHALPACATATAFAAASAPTAAVPFTEGIRATPPWMDGNTRARIGAQTLVVPQPEQPAELFASLPPLAGDVGGGVVVCQVTAGRPLNDARFMRISAHLGGLPEVVHQAAAGASTATFSLPGVTLRKGERIALDVATMDGSCRLGPIAWWIPIPILNCDEATVRKETSAATFAGAMPLAMAAAGHKAECRALSRADVEARFLERLATADAWFPKLCGSLRVDGDKRALGWPSPATLPAGLIDTSPLHDVAAFVGWADPRVQARLGHAQAIRNDWASALGQWVAAEARKLPDSGSATKLLDAVQLRLASGLDCDAGAVGRYRPGDKPPPGQRGCVLSLEIENVTAQPLDLTTSNAGGLAGLSLRKGLIWRQVDLLLSSGETAGTSVATVMQEGKSQPQGATVQIAPGADVTVELAMGLTDAQVALQAPVILRLFHDDERYTETATFLRVR